MESVTRFDPFLICSKYSTWVHEDANFFNLANIFAKKLRVCLVVDYAC